MWLEFRRRLAPSAIRPLLEDSCSDFVTEKYLSLKFGKSLLNSPQNCNRASAIAQQQVSNARWVPYSANYTETVSIRGSSGSPTQNQTLSEEIRSDDGTLLTVVTVGGKKMSGKLWQASGQMFSIDYLSKRAVLTGKLPRRHPFTPPDASLRYEDNCGDSVYCLSSAHQKRQRHNLCGHG